MEAKFNVKPGDLIEISRWGFKHWAVYTGEDEVVHFSTDSGLSSGSLANSGTGMVKHEKLTDVVSNNRHQVNNLLDYKLRPRDPSIIVKEARAMVGRVLKYDLVNNNCEHFATEMRYGVAESWQVKKTAWNAGILGTTVAFFAGGPGVALGFTAAGAYAVGAALFSGRSSS
ncbi:phospholipase A and acyltransferase 4 [Pleuronectes platessa]|uniref:phospholipase A and acyltransferase 4 n=1 Tax=Pleuronectes platessa TaxID=8262 RepID=UPI00232A19C5|nr:phospholipase A and acyltransferase 4 [Pleuronectes platessa]